MKELAVSAIGATGTVGCSNDICSFLSQSFIYALPLDGAKSSFFCDVNVQTIRLS